MSKDREGVKLQVADIVHLLEEGIFATIKEIVDRKILKVTVENEDGKQQTKTVEAAQTAYISRP